MRKRNLMLSLLPLLLLSSCGGYEVKADNIIDESTLIVDSPRATYDNSFSKEFIPEYWDSYGCGDPFVFRYAGMYYLYVSSPNYAYAVMGWKSKDLIHWEQCDNGVNQKGLVGEHDCLFTAFAPEVCHFNGYFYMCESRRGTGHYILRATSPEGPFEPITDNIAQEIDGSFYVDDNEKIYFLRASHSGIRINEMDENDNMKIVANKQLEDTQIGGWTEGPHMFKKDGTYYLTYTGTNVTCDGYRVAYSYHKQERKGDFFNARGFTYGNLLLLNCEDGFTGLGHSSNVMGPNMDSEYIVYHNLVSLNGPYRHYNLNRLMFNGTEMSVDRPSLHDNLVPEMPSFYSYTGEGLSEDGSFILSSSATKSRYTAEWNSKGNVKNIFGYESPTSYGYVKMGADNKLSIVKVSGGEEKTIKSVQMAKSYNFDVNHTYRLSVDGNRVKLNFDGMDKIEDDLAYPLPGGKIGYEKGADYAFTAFSNEAFDSSERNEYKQESALSDSYDEAISNVGEANVIEIEREVEGNGFEGGHAMKLDKDGERASYKTYFLEDGYYGLDLSVPTSYMGKRVAYRIDNGPIQYGKIPTYSIDNNRIKAHVGNFEAKKGSHYITIYYAGDEIAFSRLDWYKTTEMKTVYESDLSDYLTRGAIYVNAWKIKYAGHYALSGNRQLLYIGSDLMRDYSIECDITFDGETNANTAGVVLRASNASFGIVDTVDSIVGFHCGFNLTKCFITESHYNQTVIGESDAISFTSGRRYHLKATIIGNEVKLYLDGALKLSYVTSDGPTHGRAALYTNGAAAIYQNLRVETF